MVDVEGHEGDVIAHFPFRTTRVHRVRYEAKHLAPHLLRGIRDTLTTSGFVRRTHAGGDETWVVARM